MQRWPYGIIGLTSAGLGLAAGHALASLVNPASSPIVAVGAVFIDLTPPWLKDFAGAAFGTADKLVLLIGIGVVVAALAFGAGLLARRSPRAGIVATAALALLPTIAALSRPGAGVVDALPGLLAGVVGAGALTLQRRTLETPRSTSPGGEGGLDRRRFIVATAGTAVGSGILASLGGSAAPSAVTPVVLPPLPSTEPAIPGGLEAMAPGISPLRTPTKDFYRIDIALSPPRIDPAEWKLTIDGLVGKPLTISWDELLAMPMIERDITLTCVSNPIGGDLCGSTRWRGVRVADLLRRADPRPGADMVLSSSPDGFSASTPLAVLLDGRDAMIAIAMDGEPLTSIHGAPARLLTPGLYGFVGATKWLTRLKVTTFAEDKAYWTTRGWSEEGPVKTSARIDTPRQAAKVGEVIIGGVAWATHRGVSAVEVQVDDGPWLPATLGPDVGVDYWRQWYLRWQATPGQHRLAARAYDTDGRPQEEAIRAVAPDGATGYHRVGINVT
ncbi:MAG: molybdopterin-dependent oxidoreductase [Micropruina sp.]|nr:molybdopterin-dependent oxidoreductase [Micropruina sp.]